MGKIRRFLGFLAFLFIVAFNANAIAAGYTCPTSATYTSCNPGYYLSDCGSYRDGRTISTPVAGNSCTACPDGDYICDGGKVCPRIDCTPVKLRDINNDYFYEPVSFPGWDDQTTIYYKESTGYFYSDSSCTTRQTISGITPTATGYNFQFWGDSNESQIICDDAVYAIICADSLDSNLAAAGYELQPYWNCAAPFIDYGDRWNNDPDGVCVADASANFNKAGGTGGDDAIYLEGGGARVIYNINNQRIKENCTTDPKQNAAGPVVSNVAIPTKSGYNFDGYYSAASGGTQYVTSEGCITTVGYELVYDLPDQGSATWYAHWSPACDDCTDGYGNPICTSSESNGQCIYECNYGYTDDGTPTGDYSNLSSSSCLPIERQITCNAATAATSGMPQTVTDGVTQSITPPTKTGYTFAGATIENIDEVTDMLGYTNTDIISISSNGLISTNYGDGNVDNVWLFDTLTGSNGFEYSYYEDAIPFVCSWTPNTYTVSFNANGGTGGQSANVTATFDASMPTISTTAPTRIGYTFMGWYDKENYTASGATQYYTAAGASAKNWDKPNAAQLYAGWKPNEYKITLNWNVPVTASRPDEISTEPINSDEISLETVPGPSALYTRYKVGAFRDSARTELMTATSNPITTTLDGYTFAGYYDAETGGTQLINASGYITQDGIYAAKNTNANSTIWYAHWTANTNTIYLDKNGGTGVIRIDEDEYLAADMGQMTCTTGSSISLPAWEPRFVLEQSIYPATSITKGSGTTAKVFLGWSSDSTCDRINCVQLIDTCPTNPTTTLYAVWGTPSCIVDGTTVANTSLNGVSNNAPVCNRSSNAGYYCPATQTGTAGATTVTVTCTAAPDGSYAVAGSTTATECPIGSYSASSTASASCTVCPAGKTTSGTGTHYIANASIACSVTCPNADHVAQWATPSWNSSSGTVGNLCTVNACDTGYSVSDIATAVSSGSCVANQYTISYNLNGGANGTNRPTSATYDTTFTVDNPTHEHGQFAGWNITGMDTVTHTYGTSTTTSTSITGTTATSFKNLRSTSGTVTFTAKWTCTGGYSGDTCGTNNITLNFNNGDHGSVPATLPAFCTYGSTFNMPSAPANVTGYTFNGWTLNGTTYTAGQQNVPCDQTTLGVTSGSATITASWTANAYNCDPGEYLPANSTTCTTCPANSYCPGLTNVNYSSTAQGITACSTLGDHSYTKSISGASESSQCYKACTLSNAGRDHATAVSGNTYYGFGFNTCSAETCETGYTPTKILANSVATKTTATTYDGQRNVDAGREVTLSDYNTSGNSTFVSDYGDLGYVVGHGYCSTENPSNVLDSSGHASNITDDIVYTVNPPRLISNAQQKISNGQTPEQSDYWYGTVEENGATKCYCQIKGPNGYNNLWSLGTWDRSAYSCAWGCATNCVLVLGYHSNATNQARANYMASASDLGDVKSCVLNTITLAFTNGGHGEVPSDAPTSCTYGSTFNMPSAPESVPGYTFNGWTLNGTTYTAGQQNISCDEATLGVASGSATITASWTANTFTVNIIGNSSDCSGVTDGEERAWCTQQVDLSRGSCASVTCTYDQNCTAPTWNGTTCNLYDSENERTLTRFSTYDGTIVASGGSLRNLATSGSVNLYPLYTDCEHETSTSQHAEDIEVRVVNNTCEYNHTCDAGYWNANSGSWTTATTINCDACTNTKPNNATWSSGNTSTPCEWYCPGKKTLGGLVCSGDGCDFGTSNPNNLACEDIHRQITCSTNKVAGTNTNMTNLNITGMPQTVTNTITESIVVPTASGYTFAGATLDTAANNNALRGMSISIASNGAIQGMDDDEYWDFEEQWTDELGYEADDYTGDVPFVCSWTPNTFNVTYNAGGGTGSAPTSPTSCTYNGTCNAPANTYSKTGSNFTGWTCTASSGSCAKDFYSANESINTATTVNGATITLTATWSACAPCANSNTVTECSPSVVNNQCTYSATCATGYSTAGYPTNSGTAATCNGTTCTCKPNGYEITLDNTTNGGSGVLSKIYTIYGDGYCTDSARTDCLDSLEGQSIYDLPTKANAYFNGYYTAASGGDEIVNSIGDFVNNYDISPSTITSNATYYAQYSCEPDYFEDANGVCIAYTSAQATGNSKIYDGSPLSCTGNITYSDYNLDLLEDYTIEYSTDGGATYSTTVPTVTNIADSKTINYRVSKTGYETQTGTFNCTITANTVTITINKNGGVGSLGLSDITGGTATVATNSSANNAIITCTNGTKFKTTGVHFESDENKQYNLYPNSKRYGTAADGGALDSDIITCPATDTTLYLLWDCIYGTSTTAEIPTSTSEYMNIPRTSNCYWFSHKISFSGATNVSFVSEDVDNIRLSPEPTRTYYHFNGATPNCNSSVVTGNAVLNAICSSLQPFNSNGSYTGNTNITQLLVSKGYGPESLPASVIIPYNTTWEPDTYTVVYNANKPSRASGNVTGTMANSVFETRESTHQLSSNGYSLSGWTFKGWAKTKNARTAQYTDGQNVSNLSTTNGATVNLYAVWQQNCVPVILDKYNEINYYTDLPGWTNRTIYYKPSEGRFYSDNSCSTILTYSEINNLPEYDVVWEGSFEVQEAGYYGLPIIDSDGGDAVINTATYEGDDGETYTAEDALEMSDYTLMPYWECKDGYIMDDPTGGICERTMSTITINKNGGSGYIDDAGTYNGGTADETFVCNIGSDYYMDMCEYGDDAQLVTKGNGSMCGTGFLDSPHGDEIEQICPETDTTIYVAYSCRLGYTDDGTPEGYAGPFGDSVDECYPIERTLSLSRGNEGPLNVVVHFGDETIGQLPTRNGYTFDGCTADWDTMGEMDSEISYIMSESAGYMEIDSSGYITNGGEGGGDNWNLEEEMAYHGYSPDQIPSGMVVPFVCDWTPHETNVTLNKNTSATDNTVVANVMATYDAAMPSKDTSNANLTVLTRTGYTFTGYYDARSGGNKYYGVNNNTLVSTQNWNKDIASVTLYAQWTANKYNVTYNCGSGEGTAPTSVQATYDSNFTPSAVGGCTKPGYSFTGWNDGTSNRVAGTAFKWTYTSAKAFTAQWTPNVYEIVLNDDSDSTTHGTPSTLYMKYDTGWYTDAAATNEITALTTLPIKSGYEFVAYKLGDVEIIDAEGKFTTNNFTTENTTINVEWVAGIVECSPGYYYVGSGPTCTLCQENFFCPGGEFTTDSGTPEGLSACPNGGASAPGASANTSCYADNLNTYRATYGSGTQTCYYNGTNAYNARCTNNAITKCNAGYYYDVASTTATNPDCVPVGPNYYSPANLITRTACPSSHPYSQGDTTPNIGLCYAECVMATNAHQMTGRNYYDSANGICSIASCQPGYYLPRGQNGTCALCPEGFYCDGTYDDMTLPGATVVPNGYRAKSVIIDSTDGTVDYETGGTGLDDLYLGQWEVRYTENALRGKLRGISSCGVSEPSDSDIYGGGAVGKNCYCRMTEWTPENDVTYSVFADWALANSYSSEAFCTNACALYCGSRMVSRQATRTAIFGDGYHVGNGSTSCSTLGSGDAFTEWSYSPAGSDAKEDCYSTCSDRTVTYGHAYPVNNTENWPNVCEFTGTSNTGNPCKVAELAEGKCVESACQSNYEMISGVCQLCNRENATVYESTGNCVVAQCVNGFHPNGDACVGDVNDCTASIPNATLANSTWDTTTRAFGICKVEECDDGYHIASNACVPDEQTCSVPHGVGTQTWNDNTDKWNACEPTSCDAGYTSDSSEKKNQNEACSECSNKYLDNGDQAVSSYVRGCEVASCMYQGEKYALQGGECVPICQDTTDEFGNKKKWNPRTQKCEFTCQPGYVPW